jgi:hypothetical protein
METNVSGFWSRAWRGQERLWKIWWLVGVPLRIIGPILVAFIADEFGAGSPFVVLIASLVLLVAYLAWCVMAWRNALNVENMIWASVARVIIVLGLLFTAFDWIKAFSGGS